MRFKYTILYVNDVATSLIFYEKAFALKRKMLHEGGDYGELDTGETTLAFSSHTLMQSLGKSPARPQANSPVFEIAFETDDVAAATEKAVSHGATLMQAPRAEEWGQTTAYVSDPDGYLVEMCSPVQV